MLKLYPDNLITVIIMLSTPLQCCIVIVMQIKRTVVVVDSGDPRFTSGKVGVIFLKKVRKSIKDKSLLSQEGAVLLPKSPSLDPARNAS